MIYLDSATARGIAEAVWGRGGTSSERTNRVGAYYFNCSGHGGFVIDSAVFTEHEREQIDLYASPETATAYVYNGSVEAYMHQYRQRSAKVNAQAQGLPAKYYLFEEDCAWCLPVLFADIRTKTMMVNYAKSAFWNSYDPANPAVAARKIADARRAAHDPDMITSALNYTAGGTGCVKVWCADNSAWLVEGYDSARDEWGYPWLSRCTNVRAFVE